MYLPAAYNTPLLHLHSVQYLLVNSMHGVPLPAAHNTHLFWLHAVRHQLHVSPQLCQPDASCSRCLTQLHKLGGSCAPRTPSVQYGCQLFNQAIFSSFVDYGSCAPRLPPHWEDTCAMRRRLRHKSGPISAVHGERKSSRSGWRSNGLISVS